MNKDFKKVEVFSSYDYENDEGHLMTHFYGSDGEYVSYEDYKELLAAYNKLQQSPAVAVPDDEGYADKYMDLLSDVLDAKEVMRDAGVSHNVFSIMFAEYSKLFSSPRITEQDAMNNGAEVYLFRRKGLEPFLTCSRERFSELSRNESFETKILYENALFSAPYPHPRISEDELKLIAKKYYDWCNSEVIFNRRTMLETWVNDEGRALLNKLNEEAS